MNIVWLCRRQNAMKTIPKKSIEETSSHNPIFGKLNPMTILSMLMKSNPKKKDNFDNHKYTKDDYINLMQPTNHKNPSSEYDQEYFSLNEVALGSELHESTYSDENDNYQQIDRIGTEYDYYDYDYEDQDSKETKVELDENTKDNDDDYESYYYYTYEYIDPEDLELQYERLPKPSYQISTNKTFLDDSLDLSAKDSKLQFERLPEPSVQISSNTTLLNDNQDLPEK